MSIQTDHDGEVRTVDVAVCAQTPVAVLLPAVNDAVHLWPQSADARRWLLCRPVGRSLDDSMSLRDNGVHDGELLVLTADPPPPRVPATREVARVVADAGQPVHEWGGRVREAFCTSAVLLAAAALGWTGIATRGVGHLVVAAIGAGAVCWTAVLGRHPTLPVAGAACAAVTGFLAVPSGPAATNVFLAAAAAFAAATVMMRCMGRVSAALITTATVSVLVTAVAGFAVFVDLPVATMGAALASGALGLLAMAPRVAILLTGLGPRHDEAPPVEAVRATDGHAALTGLVAGAALAVVAGTAMVAVAGAQADVSPVAAMSFASATGLIMLLRTRVYLDTARRLTVLMSGFLTITAAFASYATVTPGQAYWVAAAVAALALAALTPRRLTAQTARAVDLVEYGLLAAVIPLACWVIGVYATMRALPLS